MEVPTRASLPFAEDLHKNRSRTSTSRSHQQPDPTCVAASPVAAQGMGCRAVLERVRVSVQRKWRWAISMRADNVSRQSSAFVITATAVPDAGQANEKQL